MPAPSPPSFKPSPAPNWQKWLGLLPILATAQVVFFLESKARCLATIAGRPYAFLIEDAMISMRYAYNSVHGHGLVFNPGERVQGYTNLGWTLLMALAQMLAPPELAAIPVLAAAFLVHGLLILAVFRAAAPLGLPPAWLAAFLVGFSGPLLLWGTGGMEAPAFALFTLLAFAPFIPGLEDSGRREWAPVFAGLGFLIRADGLLFFAVACVLLLAGRHRPARRRALVGVGVGMIPVVGVLLFQRLYYGAWLPNTFHTKVADGATDLGRGLGYLWHSTISDTFEAPLLLGGLIGLVAAIRRSRSGWAPASVVLAWLAYVAWVGGDAFVGARFLAPILPLLALLTALGMSWLYEIVRAHRGWQTGVCVTLAMVFVLTLARHEQLLWRSHRDYDRPTNAHLSSLVVGLAIERSKLPGSRPIAVLAAGITPYFAPTHRFHDMLGKCDPVIARTPAHPGLPGHRKWDFQYSLGVLKPALVISSAPYNLRRSDESYAVQATTDRRTPFAPALWIDPTFRAHYRSNRVSIFLGGGLVDTGHWLFAADDVKIRRLDL